MKKWGVALLTGVLTAVIVGTVGFGSYGFRNWHISEWFDRWGKGEEKEAVAVGGGMVLPENPKDGDAESAAPLRLTSRVLEPEAYAENGVEVGAESAVTVTATVDPDNSATNSVIVWELTWKDAASAWASGKAVSDYVTATSNEDSILGSKTVALSCLQSFGEPIILTAKCKYEESITASLQIDYAPRLRLLQTIFTDETFSNQDSEGTVADIGFGRDSYVTLELNEADKTPAYQRLYPLGIEYELVGDYTIADNYHFELLTSPKEGFENPDDSAVPQYQWVNTENDLGNYSVGIDEKSARIDFGKSYWEQSDQEGAPMVFAGAAPCKNICRIRYEMSGSSGMKPIPVKLWDDFNGNIDSIYNLINSEIENKQGKIPLLELRLKLTGSKATYEFTTDVYVTKVLKSVKLTNIELDQSGIIF